MRTKLSAVAGAPFLPPAGQGLPEPTEGTEGNSCSGQGSPDLGTWSPGWGLLTATFFPTAAVCGDTIQAIHAPMPPPLAIRGGEDMEPAAGGLDTCLTSLVCR